MTPRASHRSASQAGGVTILVALMLLVFITLVAVGMSRNSFREVVISGTSRQGSMVRNVGDSGIEWGIFWMDPKNATSSPSGTASTLLQLKAALLADSTKSGKPYNGAIATPTDYTTANPPTPPADLSFTTDPNTTQGLSVALTRMGKLPLTDTSQGNDPGSFSPAKGGENKQAPDLWALRTDAQLTMGSSLLGTKFIHSKEAWISTPVQ